jgi:hypothetical protein
MVDQAFFLRAGDAGPEVKGTAGNVLTFQPDGRVAGEAPAGGVGVLDQVVYVSKAAASGGDGSLGAPFNNLQAAADALSVLVPTQGGMVLVGPGDYSAESLSYSDDVSIAWVSMGPLLQTTQGAFYCPSAPRFPGIALQTGVGGSVQCFQGLILGTTLDLLGATLASFTGCVGVSVTGAQLLTVTGGQLISSAVEIATVLLQNVDIFNASISANAYVYLMGCNSWGQAVSVAFPPASPPGNFCYYDVVTKGNATNQAPTVSDGVALFMGLPPQSITGTTEQEQIDSIVQALVTLGVATDDR